MRWFKKDTRNIKSKLLKTYNIIINILVGIAILITLCSIVFKYLDINYDDLMPTCVDQDTLKFVDLLYVASFICLAITLAFGKRYMFLLWFAFIVYVSSNLSMIRDIELSSVYEIKFDDEDYYKNTISENPERYRCLEETSVLDW